MKQLLMNQYFVWCIMAVIVFLITQLCKLPIKACTKHIKNVRTRKMVNATILLIPFGIGVLLEFLYATYIVHQAFTVLAGLGYGTAGISLYGIVERFFKVKIPNPYESEEGKAVIDLVKDVTADNKVDVEDCDAVTKFLNAVDIKDNGTKSSK